MNKINLILFLFFFGLGVGITYYFFIKKSATSEESKILSHEIRKLNKMIVLEQNHQQFYTHQNSTLGDNFVGNLFDVDDKKLVLHVNTKVQAVYDLKKMKIKMDSVSKTIVIEKIPPLEIQLFPEVEVFHIEQGLLNTYSTKDLQQIINNSKEEVKKHIDKESIKPLAEKQFAENLQDLFFIAKTYNWKVITPQEENTIFEKINFN